MFLRIWHSFGLKVGGGVCERQKQILRFAQDDKSEWMKSLNQDDTLVWMTKLSQGDESVSRGSFCGFLCSGV
jgi:hypothetical protein